MRLRVHEFFFIAFIGPLRIGKQVNVQVIDIQINQFLILYDFLRERPLLVVEYVKSIRFSFGLHTARPTNVHISDVV